MDKQEYGVSFFDSRCISKSSTFTLFVCTLPTVHISALNVSHFMRYINSRLTYLLIYLLTFALEINTITYSIRDKRSTNTHKNSARTSDTQT